MKLARGFIAGASMCFVVVTFASASAHIGSRSVGLTAGRAIVNRSETPFAAAGRIFAKATQLLEVEDLNDLLWPVPDKAINTPFTGEHSGIDIEGETGDPIVAAASGVVEFVGDDGDGYGRKIIIRHDDRMSTLYSHLQGLEVSKGRIERGDRIGTVGCTGSCSGDHLHFEVLINGTPTDPTGYLKSSP